jgi:hypothetical protein
MPSRRRSSPSRLAADATALAVATPQVVAHRIARMALAGPVPDARDRAELQRMGAEKVAAFYESWTAMYAEALRAQWQLSASLMQAMWTPWLAPRAVRRIGEAYADSVTRGVASAGLAPVRRRATANAKRLGKAARR